MRAGSFFALTAGLLGDQMPSIFGRARPRSERDKEKLDPRFIDEARAMADAKRARKAAKR